ncbi:hypothetical protein CU097_015851 [Rhizopus azygosporus]|uniref:Transmembrane protein 198 n=1 Tax=Rhizopus azygosporus TaxID=86630 RepID=A0A367KHF1_RHIAZ|nr:hypothetical protein CU097_015851 [Rhizopus azygosporus]CEG68780.1 hypothetical protein RMATCC62417_04973 [Rhizopus microsporus]CEJ04436.1 hypothetical protein RMCBS344292_18397 [Rhizopus microsporus]
MFFSKRNTTLYLFLLLAILGTFLADAAPIGSVDGNSATITFAGHTVTVHGIVFSVVAFVTGGYLCFLGGVFQSFTMFIVGFYVGANVAFIVLTNAKADYGANTDTILLVVSIVAGVLCGGLLCCCFFLAVYLLGALLGYLAALWLLSWNTNGLIQSNWGRAILIVCFVIAGVILIAFLERPVFVIATAFIGSFAIFVGVDIYVKTGFLELVNQLLHARTMDLVVDATPALRGMLAGCLGLALVGSLIQWCMLRRDSATYRGWKERYPYGGGWRRV